MLLDKCSLLRFESLTKNWIGNSYLKQELSRIKLEGEEVFGKFLCILHLTSQLHLAGSDCSVNSHLFLNGPHVFGEACVRYPFGERECAVYGMFTVTVLLVLLLEDEGWYQSRNLSQPG